MKNQPLLAEMSFRVNIQYHYRPINVGTKQVKCTWNLKQEVPFCIAFTCKTVLPSTNNTVTPGISRWRHWILEIQVLPRLLLYFDVKFKQEKTKSILISYFNKNLMYNSLRMNQSANFHADHPAKKVNRIKRAVRVRIVIM